MFILLAIRPLGDKSQKLPKRRVYWLTRRRKDDCGRRGRGPYFSGGVSEYPSWSSGFAEGWKYYDMFDK
jgi:hypothetical protein